MGRKGWKQELKTRKLAKISEDVLIRALTASDEEFTFKEKAELAAKIYSRIIPKNYNIMGSSDLTVSVINYQRPKTIEARVIDDKPCLDNGSEIDSKAPISLSESKTVGR
jgi:hypothetical protein